MARCMSSSIVGVAVSRRRHWPLRRERSGRPVRGSMPISSAVMTMSPGRDVDAVSGAARRRLSCESAPALTALMRALVHRMSVSPVDPAPMNPSNAEDAAAVGDSPRASALTAAASDATPPIAAVMPVASVPITAPKPLPT